MANNIDKRIYLQLEKLYPDKVVTSLHKTNLSLYNEIRNYLSASDMKLGDYIESLGFTYIRRKKEDNFEDVKIKLTDLYPDKIIKNLSKMINENSNLYSKIRNEARKNNQLPKEFLTSLGYTIYTTRKSKIKYDTEAIKKLKNEFHCNFSELSEIIGTSKQNLMQKTSLKRQTPPFWKQPLTNDEVSIILEIIENQLFYQEHVELNTFFKIYKHIEIPTSFAIFIINQDTKNIKCLFELPSEVFNKLIKHKYHQYHEQDFKIKEELYNHRLVTVNQLGEKEVRLSNNHNLYNKVGHRALNFFNMTRIEYIEFLGFKHVNSQIRTDEDLKSVLSRYVVKGTNYVHIPIDDENYHRMTNIAHNRGHGSLKNFIEYYGFKYKRIKRTNTKETVIEKIKALYTLDVNKVYVSTYDPFYSNLFGYALKRNFKNVTELLKEWGFERVYLADLPSNYQPYDWQKDLDSRTFEVESDYQAILDDMIIEDNKVYIDSQSSFYTKLYVLSVRKGKGINELLHDWGYERIYDRKSIAETEAYSHKEQDRLRESLERVKQIQGALSKSTSTEQKIQRSRKLANEMKKLYGHRCQLCNYEKEGEYIPLIIKRDGTNYMEVHHIIPVSQHDEVEDDTNAKIDTYENVIVVCSHHHRYLHYHDGGFEEILETKNGELFFQSRNGMEIRIFTNYHLIAENKGKIMA